MKTLGSALRWLLFSLAPLGGLLLAACGGGGGGDDSAVVPGPDGPALSAIGQFPVGVAYLADAEVDGTFALWGAALDGSAYGRLSSPPAGTESVTSFSWSPDRTRIAYLTADGAGDTALFVTSVDAGHVLRVGSSLSPRDVQWSPDSTRLAVREWVSTALWSVGADGAGLARLSTPAAAGRIVAAYAWSPDSMRVAYVSDEVVSNVPRLFVVPATGGTAVQVSAFLPAGDQVGDGTFGLFSSQGSFAWSPGSDRLVFEQFHPGSPYTEFLRSVAPDGTAPAALSSLASGTAATDFAFAPNGSRVAFLNRAVSSTDLPTLRTVTPLGTNPRSIADAGGFGLVNAFGVAWSPDSTRIAFLGYSVLLGTTACCGVEATGVVHPSGATVEDSSSPFGSFAWSDDSAHYLFLDESGAGRRLWVSDGGFDARSFGAGGACAAPSWSPDGARLCYLSEAGSSGPFQALVSLEAGDYGTVRVSPAPGFSRGTQTVGWTSDGSAALSVSDPTGFDRMELFAAAPDGTHLRRVSGPLTFGGQVTAWTAR